MADCDTRRMRPGAGRRRVGELSRDAGQIINFGEPDENAHLAVHVPVEPEDVRVEIHRGRRVETKSPGVYPVSNGRVIRRIFLSGARQPRLTKIL